MSHSLRKTAVLGLLALACAPAAAQAAAPASLHVAWRPSPNFTPANRPGSIIQRIVIHATEGGYFAAVSWLQNSKAQASAHYVVSKTGAVTQLVRDSDIAWHAGNWQINRTSIGIEHEGFVNVPNSFTDAEYRASAQLAAYIARSHLMPIDRQHFIGHSEVPDPNHPGQFGGFAHHTDPGRYWDWERYLGYVRTYAKGSTPPVFAAPKPTTQTVSVHTKPATTTKPDEKKGGGSPSIGPIFAFQGLQPGKGLTGFVPWQADVKPDNVSRVEFLVDDTLRWTAKSAPFRFGGDDGKLDTTQLPNGPHVLSIRVVSKNGTVVGSSVKVGIANTPFAVAVVSPANAQVVKGKVRLSAGVSGGLADHVEFVVDGRVVQTEKNPPFELDWDTTKVTNGAHTLTLRGTAQDGRVATTSVTVVVNNPASVAPTPAPAPSSSSSSSSAPKLTYIRLYGSSIRDGQTVSGLVRWDAYVGGRDVERVDFSVDGALRWQDRGNPYRFNGDSGRWDTRAETNGPHVLTLRAVAVSGAESSATIVVTVQNSAPAALTATLAPPPTTSSTTTTTTTRPTTTTTTAPTTTTTAPRPTTTTAPTSSSSTTSTTVPKSTTTTAPAPTTTAPTTTAPHATTTAPTTSSTPTSTSTPSSTTTATRATTTTSSSTTPTATAPAVAVTIALAGLTNGQTISDTVHLVATTTGDVRRVEFWIDGSYRGSDYSAPYEADLSPRRLANGSHVLLVRAAGRNGTVADANVTFTVAR